MADIITAEHVGRVFKSGSEDFRALNDISLHVPEGQLTILRGRSGSGKTTLMNILGALDLPTEGSVYFDGRDIVKLSEMERTALRRKEIGFVFQSIALIPMMSAYENIDFALRMAGEKEGRRERSMECLKLVGLSQRADHLPQELSGGEQQRVAIAWALAHRPKVIFADEPTGALDTASGLTVVKIFKDLIREEGVTIVMTTHDVGLMELGDVVYELEGGELIHGE